MLKTIITVDEPQAPWWIVVPGSSESTNYTKQIFEEIQTKCFIMNTNQYKVKAEWEEIKEIIKMEGNIKQRV